MRERLVAHCPLVRSGRAVYAQRITKMLTLGGFMEKPSVARTTVPETLWQNAPSSDRLAEHGPVTPLFCVSHNLRIDF